MEYKDYYKILGVAKEATQDEIKRAYRKLARKYHPDVNKDTAAELRFTEIGEAYEVLKDKEKRDAYDRFGSNWKAGQDFKTPPGWNFQEFAGQRRYSAGNAQGFSDFFEAMFGGGARRQPAEGFSIFESEMTDRGQDIRAKIAISLEDSYRGSRKSISLNRNVPRGTGYSTETTSLQVTIPKGILEGQQIRLEGQGDMMYERGRRGDLFLEVVFEHHPIFSVVKRDISMTLPITPWEAALGATVKVPTLDGAVDLKVPPGSQTGNKLRLRGKGLCAAQQSGDQYVVLAVFTPKAVTEQQKRLYEEMAKAMPFNPRKKLGV